MRSRLSMRALLRRYRNIGRIQFLLAVNCHVWLGESLLRRPSRHRRHFDRRAATHTWHQVAHARPEEIETHHDKEDGDDNPFGENSDWCESPSRHPEKFSAGNLGQRCPRRFTKTPSNLPSESWR